MDPAGIGRNNHGSGLLFVWLKYDTKTRKVGKAQTVHVPYKVDTNVDGSKSSIATPRCSGHIPTI